MLSRVLISLFFAALTALPAAAQTTLTPAEKARDEEVAQRAKQRQYPGGPDESDLKLQNPLPTPVRKIAPTVEDEQKPESAETEN